MAALCVPDEVVIGFFTAVVSGLTVAVVALWNKLNHP
jgi:ABC-type nitrate/sulfonate/bicarbonate transport system permease component